MRNPLSFDEISEKFSDLTKDLLSEDQMEKIILEIRNLEKAKNILRLIEICHVLGREKKE
jgi:hypothetical protein